MSTLHLSTEDLAQIVELVTGEPLEASLRDVGLLAGAVARPRARRDGVDAYEGLPRKAAALLEALGGNNALRDGNRRIAWVAVNVFVELNRHRLVFSENEAFILLHEVSLGHVRFDDIAERIAARLQPLEPVGA